MTAFIRQLTGVRFIAAMWVVLYHFQGPLDRMHLLVPVLADVLRVGRLGVDLFFALSGFILTYTYLHKLGPKLAGRGAGIFLWLRLARIWPVHFVMLNVAGLALVAQSKVSGEAIARDWFNPVDYLKNVFLVQEWGPSPQRGWNFVAWSLSMEWLAYLLFPLLVLALWQFHKKVPTWGLCVLWALSLAPLLVYGLSRDDSYYTDRWGSTYRILTEFTAGAITYLIVSRFVPTGRPDPAVRVERLATTLSVVMPVIIVLGCILLSHWSAAQPPIMNLAADAEPLPPFWHLELVPFLVVWIGALALSRRGLSTWLSTDRLVLGGFISYSLYMTHLVWFGLWRATLKALHINGGPLYFLAFIGLVLGAVVIAYAMWRWVEEPAREWMRSKVGARPKPVGEDTIDPSPTSGTA